MTFYHIHTLQPHFVETLHSLQQKLGFMPKTWGFSPKLTLVDHVPTLDVTHILEVVQEVEYEATNQLFSRINFIIRLLVVIL